MSKVKEENDGFTMVSNRVNHLDLEKEGLLTSTEGSFTLPHDPNNVNSFDFAKGNEWRSSLTSSDMFDTPQKTITVPDSPVTEGGGVLEGMGKEVLPLSFLESPVLVFPVSKLVVEIDLLTTVAIEKSHTQVTETPNAPSYKESTDSLSFYTAPYTSFHQERELDEETATSLDLSFHTAPLIRDSIISNRMSARWSLRSSLDASQSSLMFPHHALDFRTHTKRQAVEEEERLDSTASDEVSLKTTKTADSFGIAIEMLSGLVSRVTGNPLDL
jgi:hypothetical protein